MSIRPFYLRWQDIAHIYRCGRNKALKIIHMLDHIYVGRVPLVHIDTVKDYLQEHGNEIKVDWKH